MANYQDGGLAAVTGVDPDELEDPSMVQAPGALEEATSGEREPARLPTQSSRAGKTMTNVTALKRLEEARLRLVDRRDKIEADKSGQWLALAQGMLAPTQTGGFGESVGAAAGLIGGARSEHREALTNIEKDLLDAEVKQQTLLQSARARLGSSSTVYHPDDVAEFPDDSSQWRQIEKQTIVHSDGTTEHIFTGTENGELLTVVSRNNPITVSDAKKAQVAAGDAAKLRSHEIETGLNSTLAVSKLQRAREIFAGLSSTSGIKGRFIDLAQFLSIDIPEGSDFMLARRLMGSEVLNQLTLLTGTKTDFEYKKIEELNASTAKSKEANLAIIDDMLGRYENMIRFGEDAALERAEDPSTDLSVLRFRRYRDEQAAEKEMQSVEQTAEKEVPTSDSKQFLIDNYTPALLDTYRRRFGNPPPEIISELRKQGVDI